MTAANTLYVLSDDVEMHVAGELSDDIRRRITDVDDDVVLSRVGSRAPSVVVDTRTARLIWHFRESSSIIAAILAYCRETSASPRSVLDGAYPVLKKLIEREILVPPAASRKAPALPSFGPGTQLGDLELLDVAQTCEDVDVYRARTSQDRAVAVKLARDPASVATASRIRHECDVLALLAESSACGSPILGEVDGRVFVALPWHEGTDAAEYAARLRSEGSPDSRHRLKMLCVHVAEAYARLHSRGVLHGDVHPRNLIVGSGGEVAIVDYGLARIENGAEAGPSLSRAGVGFYFEPEYALSRLDGDASVPPTAAGEQYAIAALLYRLVTGNHYADFYFDERMWRQIATQVPLSFAERGTAAWSAGERVLRRALSKNPAARFANVGDFADALRIACPPPPSPVTSRQHFINMTRAFVDDLTRRIGSPRRIHSGADSAWVNDGSAGIAFGLYRLACIRQDGELLASADTMIEQACSGQTVPLGRTRQDADSASVSFYHGETGLQAVRAIISCAQCDMPAMGDAVAMFCSAAAAPSDDVDAFSGRASALIGTSLIINALPSNASAELSSLRAVGSSLAAYIDSYLERNHFSAEEGLPWLGIAHGWAGLLYATLLWSEVSGTAVTPATSATLTELGALAAESATASGDALFWPQRWASPGPLRRAEAGWCHGAAGHTLLQTAAYRVTGDDRHLRLAERAATFAYERYNGTGASLCCGLAGQAYACLSLLRVTDNDVWLRRAEQLAMRAIDRARAARYNDGLYTGLIGVGVLCADIGQPEHSHMPLFELDQM